MAIDRGAGFAFIVPVGIVTDRDLVVKALARGLDPYEAVVADAMTPCPVSVREETPIEEALRIMRSGGFRLWTAKESCWACSAWTTFSACWPKISGRSAGC